MAKGVTALHLAAQPGHMAMVTLLVERGADVFAEDGLHHATPRAWAEHSKQTAVRHYRLSDSYRNNRAA